MILAFIEGIGHDLPSLDPGDLLDHAEKDLPNESEEMISSTGGMVITSDNGGEWEDED